MSTIETGRIEKFAGDKYKNCLLRKLTEFKIAFNDSEMNEKVARLETELHKIRSEQIMDFSHFGHIIGQLNGESGYTVRLAKLKERAAVSGSQEDLLRVKGCEQQVEETREAIKDYIDLCLANKDYFYGEISSQQGYFEGKNIIPNSEKEVETLNCKEFVLLSKELLEEKENLEVTK